MCSDDFRFMMRLLTTTFSLMFLGTSIYVNLSARDAVLRLVSLPEKPQCVSFEFTLQENNSTGFENVLPQLRKFPTINKLSIQFNNERSRGETEEKTALLASTHYSPMAITPITDFNTSSWELIMNKKMTVRDLEDLIQRLMTATMPIFELEGILKFQTTHDVILNDN